MSKYKLYDPEDIEAEESVLDQPRLFQDEDLDRIVFYKPEGRYVPFKVAKFLQWRDNPYTWAIEQVYTKDETNQLVTRFPDKLYLRVLLDIVRDPKHQVILINKSRQMMITHFFVSFLLAHTLIFRPKSFSFLVSSKEDMVEEHFEDRLLFTLKHLDFRFPYPAFIDKKALSFNNTKIFSKIKGFAAGTGKARGVTGTYGLFDEAAHQPQQAENWRAIQAIIQKKRRFIDRGGIKYGLGNEDEAKEQNKLILFSSSEPGSFFNNLVTSIKEDSEFHAPCKGISYTYNIYDSCVVSLNYVADPEKDPETEVGRVWLENEKRKYTQYDWIVEMEGLTTFPKKNRVYFEFVKEIHCANFDLYKTPSLDKPVHIGLDLGFRFPCAIITYTNPADGKLVIRQCILRENVLLKTFLRENVFLELDKIYGGRHAWKGLDNWYIDPAAKASNGQGTVPPAYKEVKAYVGHSRVYYKYTLIKERVDVFNELLKEERIQIAPSCGIYIPEDKNCDDRSMVKNGVYINMLEWGYCHKTTASGRSSDNPEDTDPEKDKFFDHMSDCTGYIFAVMFYDKIIKRRVQKVRRDTVKDKDRRSLSRPDSILNSPAMKYGSSDLRRTQARKKKGVRYGSSAGSHFFKK